MILFWDMVKAKRYWRCRTFDGRALGHVEGNGIVWEGFIKTGTGPSGSRPVETESHGYWAARQAVEREAKRAAA